MVLKLPVVQHCSLGTSGGQEEPLQSVGTVRRARRGHDQRSEQEKPAVTPSAIALSGREWEAATGHRLRSSPDLKPRTMGTEFQEQLEASLEEVRWGSEKVFQVGGAFSRTLPLLSLSALARASPQCPGLPTRRLCLLHSPVAEEEGLLLSKEIAHHWPLPCSFPPHLSHLAPPFSFAYKGADQISLLAPQFTFFIIKYFERAS